MARPKKETGKVVSGFDPSFEQRMETIISRIGGLEPAAAASASSISQLTSWKFGRTRPDFFALRRLCEASGDSIEWLAWGKEPRDSRDGLHHTDSGQAKEGGNVLQIVDSAALTDKSMVMLPRLDVEAAAGAGAVVATEQVAEMVAFSTSWLRERHITPRNARILTARGDSMEPTIRDGDLLIVDTAIEMAVDNGIYCIAYNGVLLVKRLFVQRSGGIIISSDNKIAGRDEEIPAHEVPDVHIAGRVMWYGRTI